MNLFDVTIEFKEAMAALEAIEDKLDDETVRDTLEGIQGPFEDKARNVAAYIRNLEAAGDAKADAAKAMAERGNRDYNKAARLRNYLMMCMDMAHIEKVSGTQFDVKVRTNPGALIVDEDKLKFTGGEFYNLIPEHEELDKAKLKKAVIEGRVIAGAEIVKSRRLEIK